MSQSLLALDTDHIKRYVFGTSKLKEIRGASSILDHLNRVETYTTIKNIDSRAKKIFANGGSALFCVASDKAKEAGEAVQKLYHAQTGNGASITYAIQPIPEGDTQVSMQKVRHLLGLRLRLAKDDQRMAETGLIEAIALPTHPFLCTCKSCGMAYAEGVLYDPEETDNRYCRVCIKKREKDEEIRKAIPEMIDRARSVSPSAEDEEVELWARILQVVMSEKDASGNSTYRLPSDTERPPDFQAFAGLTSGKRYLGLIYADANGMGQAMDDLDPLAEVKQFAKQIDKAVFKAMGDAIRRHLPVRWHKDSNKNMLPFDILMVGGDDIVMVTPADKALQVASTLASRFQHHSAGRTLSVGVVLAPVTYPFNLQRKLAEEILKDAKKAGAVRQLEASAQASVEPAHGKTVPEESHISFVVVTGSTSLSYEKIHEEMYRNDEARQEEFHATMRPYSLTQFDWLLGQLYQDKRERIGRTKLHQMREAILKLNRTTTILEALSLFRNWNKNEAAFIKALVQEFDKRTEQERRMRGTIFPWYLADSKEPTGNDLYYTPLLDFIELYDFASS